MLEICLNKNYEHGLHSPACCRYDLLWYQWILPISFRINPLEAFGVGGLWGFLWWAPSAKRKDHHGVSSGWSSVWHRSNTGLSSTQYEQIPIILGVWPFWLTHFFFRSITFWRAHGLIVFPLLKLLSFFRLTYYCSIGLCFSVRV